jgi:hypothetical protein
MGFMMSCLPFIQSRAVWSGLVDALCKGHVVAVHQLAPIDFVMNKMLYFLSDILNNILTSNIVMPLYLH